MPPHHTPPHPTPQPHRSSWGFLITQGYHQAPVSLSFISLRIGYVPSSSATNLLSVLFVLGVGFPGVSKTDVVWSTVRWQHIKKQRNYFANKGLVKARWSSPSSQSCGFSSSHVRMWELDYKEGSAPKNWCFWTVVLEKTLESPLGCMEIQPVYPKGNQSGIFIGKTDAESEIPILWPPDSKNWLLGKHPDSGKNWRWEENGITAGEMVGCHQWIYGNEFE